MTTVADQVMMGGMGALPSGPAPAGPTGQAPSGMAPQAGPPQSPQPVGPGFQEGGLLGQIEILRRAAEQGLLPQYESLDGALTGAQSLMGESVAPGIQALLERFQAEEPELQNQELTDRLLALGTGMMTSTAPDFLSGVGAGMESLMGAQREVRDARGQRRRHNVTDQIALANLRMGENNQRTDAATSLFGAARDARGNLIDTERGIAQLLGNRETAQIYASRSGGGGSGLGNMTTPQLNAYLSNLRQTATSLATRLRAMEAAPLFNENDPTYQALLRDYQEAFTSAEQIAAIIAERAGVDAGITPGMNQPEEASPEPEAEPGFLGRVWRGVGRALGMGPDTETSAPHIMRPNEGSVEAWRQGQANRLNPPGYGYREE